MPLLRALAFALILTSCAPRASESVYYWKTSLDWSYSDTEKLEKADVKRVGLRLFDWGERGEEGPLLVRSPLPAEVEVVPVVYVTTARLEAWAVAELDAPIEARLLWRHVQDALPRAWSGKPAVWQLDADWTARTRAAWFAVAAEFGKLVHAQGGRFEVTVRLHQYRDRETQGVPPADAGVLMLYGVGDAVLDLALVSGYLKGPAYPLALTPAFPAYTQVRQLNGYGRLVALHRLRADDDLPMTDLKPLGGDRFEVTRRSELTGRPLMASDVLVVDRVDPQLLQRVRELPAVAALMSASRGYWFFDYNPGDNVPRFN